MAERFSASVAGRHMACHASAQLEIAIPGFTMPEEDRTKDNAANRGTKKHELLAPIMELSPREVRWMAEYLEYIADLRGLRRFNVLAEQSVKATWLMTQPDTTPDLVLYTQDEMHVIDGKWGQIPVELVGNEQFLFYDVCVAPLAPKAKFITNHLIQAPLGKFESWVVTTDDLAQFMAEAQAAERAINAGSVTFGPSDHCTFCPANPHSRASEKGHPKCPAMTQLLYPSTPVDEDAILSL